MSEWTSQSSLVENRSRCSLPNMESVLATVAAQNGREVAYCVGVPHLQRLVGFIHVDKIIKMNLATIADRPRLQTCPRWTGDKL